MSADWGLPADESDNNLCSKRYLCMGQRHAVDGSVAIGPISRRLGPIRLTVLKG